MIHINKTTLTLLCIGLTQSAFSQNLTEIKNVRFYEHHSSDVTSMAFGSGADGSRSGYDFVNNTHYNSFNQSTFGAYTNGEEANIDMVEHGGAFGSGGTSMYLGFTSGVSSIWNGEIKGNNTTRWMKAPAGFNYDSALTVNHLEAAYNETSARAAVGEVRNNDVFIGRIRGGNHYIVMKCHNVTPPLGPPNGQMDNSYFDFDYKYGTGSTGVSELANQQVSVYPNPAGRQVTVNLSNGSQVSSVKLYSLTGAAIEQPYSFSDNTLDLTTIPAGIYMLEVKTTNGDTMMKKLVKQDEL